MPDDWRPVSASSGLPSDGTTTAPSAPPPPSLSLPKGGGAIRGTGEKFTANPATGSASITIPLAVSPGLWGSRTRHTRLTGGDRPPPMAKHDRRRVAAAVDLHGILGADPEVRNGFSGVTVNYVIDADATADEVKALVAQSQKRSAVYDILTNPTSVTVDVA